MKTWEMRDAKDRNGNDTIELRKLPLTGSEPNDGWVTIYISGHSSMYETIKNIHLVMGEQPSLETF